MEKLAIIGISCLFPDAQTPEQYWQNLLAEKDSRSAATAVQMGVDPQIFYAPKSGVTDKYYCLHGGYIRDFQFDGHGYHLPAKMIDRMDDLFKWSLYVAQGALQDSGYGSDTAVQQRTGVILGNLSFPTQSSNHLCKPIYKQALETNAKELLHDNDLPLVGLPQNGEIAPENLKIAGYPAAFVGQALGLGGINFALDAACASSLYAVKLAGQYLLSGQADLMLAGAVSRADPFFINMGFSIFHAYPEGDATSNPLNQGSDGLFAGEGAGMFVLKRHSDAVRDGDKIYAVISGIGLSNDGKGKFLLQPNPKGQLLAFERAYAQAGVNPADIDYVECHATGTPVGDITELNSMESFFSRTDNIPLVGSAKSNFGHLLTAAGMAGMTKVILGMAHQQIPATIHLDKPLSSKNGIISGEQMVSQRTPWPKKGEIERAGVSAFGFGGTNAHLILEKEAQPSPQPKVAQPPTPSPQPKMAIVGMDAFFGSCDGLDAFGQTIYEGKQQFTAVPQGRWQGIESETELLKTYNFADGQAPQGAYISDFEMDFFHFKIPPNNDQPIPQQLLILKVADRALQDAGLAAGGNVAVIIAAGAELALHSFRGRVDLTWQIKESLAQSGLDLSAEQEAQLEKIAKTSIHEPAEVNQYTSFIGNIMASRISSQWDFSGPSFTLSAEENSTFKALQTAQMFLANGDVDAVVVGAVDLAGGVESVLLRHQQAPVNSGNMTMSLDEGANGWLVGEGAGVVVLKRQEDALQANDRIYALIDEVAIVQSTSPDPQAEHVADVVQQALSNTAVSPSEIGYLELFGSGVAQEDAAEVAGITAVYTPNQPLHPTTALGSVKANIGHTFTASGIASLIKTAHCLYHRYIPGTPGWSGPKSPELWQNSPFYVPVNARPWFKSAGQATRLAAINGLGGDGAYAHLILSEAAEQRRNDHPLLPHMSYYLFPIAGNDQATLQERVIALQTLLSADEAVDLETAVAQNLATFQTQKEEKYILSIVGNSREKVLKEIKSALKGLKKAFTTGKAWKSPAGSYFTPEPLGEKGKIAFVYPGAFSAYPGLGRDLLPMFPELHDSFADTVSNPGELVAETALYPRTMHRLSKAEMQERERQLLDDSVTMLQAGATYSTLVTQALQNRFKVQAGAALGYSLGEMTMMFALGVWSAADNKGEMLHRSPLFTERLSGPQNAVRDFWQLPSATPAEQTPIWAIFVLKTAVSNALTAVEQEERAYITHINTPKECILAGDPQACQRILTALGCNYMPVPYSHVIHCPPMQSERDEFARLNTIPVSNKPPLNFYFAAGDAQPELTSENIAHNIAEASCNPVDFPALIERAYGDGARIFIELGPRSACRWWVSGCLGEKPHLSVAIDRANMDDQSMLVRLLAQLASHHVLMDLSSLVDERLAQPADASVRSLVRTVSLTHTPMRDLFLSAENRTLFAHIALKPVTETVAVPLATAVSAPPLPMPTPIMPPAQQSITNKKEKTMTNKPKKPITPPVVNVNGRNDRDTAVSFDFFAQQLQQLDDANQNTHQLHEEFLRMRAEVAQQMGKLVQMQLEEGSDAQKMIVQNKAYSDRSLSRTMPAEAQNRPNNYLTVGETIWGPEVLEGYAGGSIVPMFGEEYAIIDAYRRRVRLPMMPYLLVDRVTELTGQKDVYEPSTMTTEYDIPFDAWYATDGQIPWGVSVESGQCDLLLISYLGIDFQNKGERVYRLLDCTLTFLEDMPLEGETLRYDISINSFAKSGDSVLFFFSYNCFVGDTMVLKMRGGCAGFFTDKALEGGKGIITTERQLEEKRQMVKSHFNPPLSTPKTSLSRDELVQLCHGDITAVFGQQYDPKQLNPSLKLPPEGVLMIDRITEVDPHGGAWGLGLIVSEKDLQPDDWYFPCHFKGDEVLAGSLVAEGCSQLLQFYLLYLGMQTETTDARFQPIKNLGQVVRTRKQIMASHSKLIYRMEITEIGMEPQPYAKANVDIIYEGIVVVDFKNLGLQLVEKAADDPYKVNGDWRLEIGDSPQLPSSPAPQLPIPAFTPRPALYDDSHIQNFAMGSISACFGPDYAVFEGRRIPRTPNGDLQLFNRVVEINAQRLKFGDNPNLVTEYDVPVDAWYTEKNSYPTMPYSVLMEIALQPCGFLSAYLGSTLPYADDDFYFRNLDGDGRLHRDFDLRGKTISNHVTLLTSTALRGIIIQKFGFAMSVDDELFYEGTAVFGYFEPESLINQVGLDAGKDVLPWFKQENVSALDVREIVLAERGDLVRETAVSPHYRLAGGQLNFLDKVITIPNGGRESKGYIYAERNIDPSDWFFTCHFYQDPVMPGSLGIEAILEAMQTYALDQNLGGHLQNPYFTHQDNHKVVWMYRGQISPTDPQMYLEVDITHVQNTANEVILTGNASIWKTGMRIYEVKEISIQLVGK